MMILKANSWTKEDRRRTARIFLGIAARVMRQILVEARLAAWQAQKRRRAVHGFSERE